MFNVKKLAFGAAMLAASAVCFAAPKVEIVTSEGNIVVNLNEKAAPTTVAVSYTHLTLPTNSRV